MPPKFKIDTKNWQTPPPVCRYMASFIKPATNRFVSVLEPTPGAGQLLAAISDTKGVAPYFPGGNGDFWKMNHYSGLLEKERKYDYVVMNPPFTPMALGFEFLEACMKLSDNIICLLPWFILINSDRRFEAIRKFGLKSVTHLPRKTFPSNRIQCVVMELKKGHTGKMELKYFDAQQWNELDLQKNR